MGSSNRHWPSMFKSKPSNTTTHQQWQHDLNNSSSHISTGSQRNHYTPVLGGCEERTPEPKPRWNPRPEQIRILEAIFNSGMVNPPRDEIRKIRAQLQEYGQVGDANVFYWFQNRKSRSKHKQRQLQNNKSQQPPHTTSAAPITTSVSSAALVAPPTSSSSSSDKSSPNSSNGKPFSVGSSTAVVHDLLNSPTASVNQHFFQASSDFLTEPFFFPVQQNSGGSTSSAAALTHCFPDVSCVVADHSVGSISLGELMLMSQGPSKKSEDDKMKLQQQISCAVTDTPIPAGPNIFPPSLYVSSPTNHVLQGASAGLVESGPPKSTVFINDVCFEVAVGPFNVKEAFGDDAVLIQSSGQPVLTNEWGVTLQPLQHGAFYYLVRAFTPSPDDRTIDLI
ncbi:WUSCHEL-related homeobox 9 [Sesamum angolense]|uniref:Protein WUSCHEL n=1 Tax=Sesamum angolense TaxID=2727404 RepID=A0AAE2BII2_9LAMI|nr:WUSCHEL-related homeobox 9 [Sesamum angolense]